MSSSLWLVSEELMILTCVLTCWFCVSGFQTLGRAAIWTPACRVSWRWRPSWGTSAARSLSGVQSLRLNWWGTAAPPHTHTHTPSILKFLHKPEEQHEITNRRKLSFLSPSADEWWRSGTPTPPKTSELKAASCVHLRGRFLFRLRSSRTSSKRWVTCL